jgi:tetratricopeptide (TPR) repeat protein
MNETTTPDKLTKDGNASYQNGRYAQAAQLFEQASRSWDASGNKVQSAEARNNASVAHLKAGDAAAALQAALGTEQIFAEAGDLRRQGMALANQASALEELGKLQEALEHFQLASSLLKQSGDKEMRASVLKNISTLQIRTGNQLQALASMDAALENQPRLSAREKMLQKLLRIPLDMLKRR